VNERIKAMSTNISGFFYITDPILEAFFIVKVRIFFIFKNITTYFFHFSKKSNARGLDQVAVNPKGTPV
jgi:hypothetical protein